MYHSDHYSSASWHCCCTFISERAAADEAAAGRGGALVVVALSATLPVAVAVALERVALESRKGKKGKERDAL